MYGEDTVEQWKREFNCATTSPQDDQEDEAITVTDPIVAAKNEKLGK